MTQSKEHSIFDSFLRQVRKLASAFKEKPSVTLEDYVLEHFMLYHGLVGTSPDNQPQFKDVRADVFDAILKRSSVQMAIALKLPPLWWEDKLAAIFTEAHQYHEEVLACLLPAGDPQDLIPDSDPLRHPDWRVRANAAKILANLGIMDAAPHLVQALADQEEPVKAAFCHIAYALAKLQSPQTRLALTKQLSNDDPWLRVDACGALSKWPLKDVSSDLMNSVLQPHALSDYAAVAITKQYTPTELLTLPDEQQEGALEIVIGLTQAARSTFANDTTFGAELEKCLDKVVDLANKRWSPRRVRAVFDLCQFVLDNCESAEVRQHALTAKQKFDMPQTVDKLANWFAGPHDSADGEFRHAIKLASQFKLKSPGQEVLEHLDRNSPFLDESVEAIGSIGGADAAPHLVRLIEQLVDLDDRTSRTLSKQPVFEENPPAAKTYWECLRSLGSLPHPDGTECLLKACRDFAADKRQQALSSVIENGDDETIRLSHGDRIKNVVRESLSDPAATVRVAALVGVESMQLTDLVDEVVRLTAERETSVSRQATETLTRLAQNGHSSLITKTLKRGISAERDVYRRQKLNALLADVTG